MHISICVVKLGDYRAPLSSIQRQAWIIHESFIFWPINFKQRTWYFVAWYLTTIEAVYHVASYTKSKFYEYLMLVFTNICSGSQRLLCFHNPTVIYMKHMMIPSLPLLLASLDVIMTTYDAASGGTVSIVVSLAFQCLCICLRAFMVQTK